MHDASLFHSDFVPEPYWWQAFRPGQSSPVTDAHESGADLPASTAVAIVGGGYAGLSVAIELARNGIQAVVLEAAEFGSGASTRNGGAVSGSISVGKTLAGCKMALTDAERRGLISEGGHAFDYLQHFIEREGISDCLQKNGRFVGAWTPQHYMDLQSRVDEMNELVQARCHMVPRERQREEIGSDFYYGGMVVEEAGTVQPAVYYKGLLHAAHRYDVTLLANTAVQAITKDATTWSLRTPRGTIKAENVVIATNGYTGDLTPAFKRRLVPVASYLIATEELPPDVALSVSPNRRMHADTRRVMCYYRLSPDGKRMIFGGRARFSSVSAQESAPILHRMMTDRFPQLARAKITHAWLGNVAFSLDYLPHMGKQDGLYYCLACNGNGVAMMSYLGYQTARKIARIPDYACDLDRPDFPSHPLYKGNPWFLPAIGSWYKFRDSIDRRLGEK